jgi:hypothetical protein
MSDPTSAIPRKKILKAKRHSQGVTENNSTFMEATPFEATPVKEPPNIFANATNTIPSVGKGTETNTKGSEGRRTVYRPKGTPKSPVKSEPPQAEVPPPSPTDTSVPVPPQQGTEQKARYRRKYTAPSSSTPVPQSTKENIPTETTGKAFK